MPKFTEKKLNKLLMEIWESGKPLPVKIINYPNDIFKKKYKFNSKPKKG